MSLHLKQIERRNLKTDQGDRNQEAQRKIRRAAKGRRRRYQKTTGKRRVKKASRKVSRKRKADQKRREEKETNQRKEEIETWLWFMNEIKSFISYIDFYIDFLSPIHLSSNEQTSLTIISFKIMNDMWHIKLYHGSSIKSSSFIAEGNQNSWHVIHSIFPIRIFSYQLVQQLLQDFTLLLFLIESLCYPFYHILITLYFPNTITSHYNKVNVLVL